MEPQIRVCLALGLQLHVMMQDGPAFRKSNRGKNLRCPGTPRDGISGTASSFSLDGKVTHSPRRAASTPQLFVVTGESAIPAVAFFCALSLDPLSRGVASNRLPHP